MDTYLIVTTQSVLLHGMPFWVYQILTLLFLGGNFLLALLTYLDGKNQHK